MTVPDPVFQALKDELLGVFERGVDEALGEESFNELALRVFRFQLEANPAYGAFVRRRLSGRELPERWEEIPHLPTRAFKSARLVAGDPDRVEAVFRTSGTTGGREKRGAHHVRSLDLYRGALVPNFRAHLLPEEGSLPVLALLPSPEEVPDSSLSFMVGEMSGAGSGFFFHPEDGLRTTEFRAALNSAEEAGRPVLLAGTAFSFLAWIQEAQENDWRFRLPPGTRIMETGGYKGRVRALPKDELYRSLTHHFGVGPEFIVNEYGMTELLSQFYEPLLIRDGEKGVASPLRRFHRGPPWVRSRTLHPLTLEPVAPGEVGILAHLDLANLGSVAAVLTEDLARSVPGGFVLQGRNPGAEPRGCSLAMETFLDALKGEENGL